MSDASAAESYDEPYLETCCRSTLHRLLLCAATGRPTGLKDQPCLERLERLGLSELRDDGRFVITQDGLKRHREEIGPTE
ncbi:hypothetical protein AD931_10335 [Gluconobacter oxydans]|uniref:Uncharacterized protein n=1 Tax=Gluconobacter oxydans TaxID=442 RepID=A0AB34XG77_GLUOY|nr:hypothetical protein [Gluconobacter oxydans]KXV07831.1 hypothetical protein AD931_10335 [Gluconobacter oxydans]